jgi:hypothetical protein
VSNFDDLIAAGLRLAEARAHARAASVAFDVADAAARLARCDAIDLEAVDREANLDAPTEPRTCMGFASGPDHSPPVDPDASGRASTMGAITSEHARAEALRAEVHSVLAGREVEAAEASLLEIAANLTSGDPPVERTAPAKQSTQSTQSATADDTIGEAE